MSKVILKKVENKNVNTNSIVSINAADDVKKLLKTNPIRGFSKEMIDAVKSDIIGGMDSNEIMEKYALTRARFKNLVFEIACSGFDVSKLQYSARKSYLKTFKCNPQGIQISNARLKINNIDIHVGDTLNLIKLSDTSFKIEVIK